MTDYIRLRELAENATRGPWAWDQNRVPTLHGQAGDPDLYVYEAEVIEAEHSGECGCRSACELELNVSDADAKFIAAANPTVVLDLLDRIATLTTQVRNQAAELEDTRAAYQLTRRQLDAHRAGQGTCEGITR